MTNPAQTFELDTARPMVFYSSEKFFADPPLLQLGGSNNLVLLLNGRAGTSCVIQTTTNLDSGVNWIPLANFALTNSFRFLDAGRPKNKPQLFRPLRP